MNRRVDDHEYILQEIDVIEDDVEPDVFVYFPEIETGIPVPKNATEALPELTLEEEVRMRAATITLLADLASNDITPTHKDARVAEALAQQMMDNPALRPDFSKYPNETIAYLAGLVSQMNSSIVHDLAELKLYVVNKLVHEIESAKDPKVRITALSKLGEVDGVDAFKRRTEVTHKIQTMEEVENELLVTLSSLKSRVIDAEVVRVD